MGPDTFSFSPSSNDNGVTGSFNHTTVSTDNSSMVETGAYQGTTYTIHENATTASNTSNVGNTYTGVDTTNITSSTTTTIHETGSNADGSFILDKTGVATLDETNFGNDVTGYYSNGIITSNTTTASETNTHSVGSSAFVETATNSTFTQENGNTFTGWYWRTIRYDNSTLTDTDNGSDAAGSFSVTENSSNTASGTQTGNSITSVYSTNETSSGSYSMTETSTPPGGSAFTLNETGSLGTTTNESGNSIVGSYNRSITGTDSYSMTETGTNPGGSFSESVNGSDNYTLTEAGNPANQTYNRTIAGSGSFSRNDSGAGATLPSNSGTISYNLTESADARAGNLSQTETGGDRYTLLEHFNNVANTGGGNDPGNMNFLPFGQPFVDPGAAGVATTRGGSVEGALVQAIETGNVSQVRFFLQLIKETAVRGVRDEVIARARAMVAGPPRGPLVPPPAPLLIPQLITIPPLPAEYESQNAPQPATSGSGSFGRRGGAWVPIFTNIGAQRGGYVIYGGLDNLDRPTGIYAHITPDMLGTGSRADQGITPPGFAGRAEGHARGHLLASQLGGSGTDRRDLVTLFQNPANTGAMSSIEAQVAAAVRAGEIVDYWVIPIYNGTGLVPTGITIIARGSNGFRLDITVLNRPHP